MLLKYILDPFNCWGKNKSAEWKALPPTSDSLCFFLLHCLWRNVDLISTVSVLLNTFKSVVLKPMGHNTVSHTVTHKYKSYVGYWVHYQKIAAKSKGPNGRSGAQAGSHLSALTSSYQPGDTLINTLRLRSALNLILDHVILLKIFQNQAQTGRSSSESIKRQCKLLFRTCAWSCFSLYSFFFFLHIWWWSDGFLHVGHKGGLWKYFPEVQYEEALQGCVPAVWPLASERWTMAPIQTISQTQSHSFIAD